LSGGLLDFLVIGAPKAGTSSLNALLSSHPKIETTRPKESRFFDLYYDRGLEYLAGCLTHADPEQLRGDCSPQNLQCIFAAERLSQSFPKARLIIVLRDPVERAYSHWWMTASRGKEKRTFEECVQHCRLQYEQHKGQLLAGPTGVELWKQYCKVRDTRETPYLPYLEIGLYHQHLERYLSLFPREQLLVLPFRDHVHSLADIARFLEVEIEDFVRDLPRYNSAKGPAGAFLDNIARASGLDALVPTKWKCALRDRLVSFGDKRPDMPSLVSTELQEFFEPANQKLFSLLGERFW
jgi:hypothetical protein